MYEEIYHNISVKDIKETMMKISCTYLAISTANGILESKKERNSTAANREFDLEVL